MPRRALAPEVLRRSRLPLASLLAQLHRQLLQLHLLLSLSLLQLLQQQPSFPSLQQQWLHQRCRSQAAPSRRHPLLLPQPQRLPSLRHRQRPLLSARRCRRQSWVVVAQALTTLLRLQLQPLRLRRQF